MEMTLERWLETSFAEWDDIEFPALEGDAELFARDFASKMIWLSEQYYEKEWKKRYGSRT